MGESDLTLGNEPLRFRNVSEDVLASKRRPGGLEDACLRFPKREVELPGGFPGVGKSGSMRAEDRLANFGSTARNPLHISAGLV